MELIILVMWCASSPLHPVGDVYEVRVQAYSVEVGFCFVKELVTVFKDGGRVKSLRIP